MAVFNVEDCSASRAPGRMLRRLDKVMRAYVEARIDDDEMTYQQWIALKVVRDGLVSTAGELARELGITTGATTRLIDVLETRALIARDRSGGDRRVVRLMTTERGDVSVEKLKGHVVGAWNEVLATFSQDEAVQFIELLARILAEAERVAGDAAMVETDQ